MSGIRTPGLDSGLDPALARVQSARARPDDEAEELLRELADDTPEALIAQALRESRRAREAS